MNGRFDDPKIYDRGQAKPCAITKGSYNMSSFLETRDVADTLRLSPEELQSILQEMSSKNEKNNCQQAGHFHNRMPYQIQHGAVIMMEQTDYPIVYFKVHPYSISPEELDLLHGTFVYPKTPCTVVLKTTDGEGIAVKGTILRCQLIRGRVHDIGVHFDKRIELSDFVITKEEPKGEHT